MLSTSSIHRLQTHSQCPEICLKPCHKGPPRDSWSKSNWMLDCLSQWGRVTHTRRKKRKKEKKSRLGLANFLMPSPPPVWSVRAPALLGFSSAQPVLTLLQTLRTDVLLWKLFKPDFDVFQRSRGVQENFSIYLEPPHGHLSSFPPFMCFLRFIYYFYSGGQML